MVNNQEEIKIWFDLLKSDILKEYDAQRLKASGKFERLLEINIKSQDNKIKGVLLGANYAEQLDRGRGKTKASGGTGVLREAIEQWVKDKGIVPRDGISRKSLVYLITRKIHRDGIKVPNKYNVGGIITKIITEQRIQELVDRLVFINVEQLSSDILIQFKNLNKV